MNHVSFECYKRVQRENGLTPVADTGNARYNHVPKLINNVFGIEMARKHSSLSHMIGPVMQRNYPPLDSILDQFLNSHKKVVYIAFGQHIIPSRNDVRMFLQTLFIMMEQELIDGIIWARINESHIPEIIETPKRKYSYKDIVDHTGFYMSKWAPQYSILKHPSTLFFISHGGVGSIYKALYNGVRLFIFPFFGDQQSNAGVIERTGVGSYMDGSNLKYNARDYVQLYRKLYRIAIDPENRVQEAVNRYKAFIQISARSAVARGADLMEESLFASDSDGHLKYQYDVGYDIHWIKRNDIDVYILLTISSLITLKIGLVISHNMKDSYILLKPKI